MGVSPFGRCRTATCRTAPSAVFAPAPNPNPKRWELLEVWVFPNAYVLRVKYLDCTNYEGIKIMVYAGKYSGPPKGGLDPHFQPGRKSPIARFRPDAKGIALAKTLAAAL